MLRLLLVAVLLAATAGNRRKPDQPIAKAKAAAKTTPKGAAKARAAPKGAAKAKAAPKGAANPPMSSSSPSTCTQTSASNRSISLLLTQSEESFFVPGRVSLETTTPITIDTFKLSIDFGLINLEN